MGNIKRGDKLVWAVDLNEKSLSKLANERQIYNYLEEPLLHDFCQKIGVSVIPFNHEEPKDTSYGHFIKATYSELNIDETKNNAIKYVINYLRVNLRRKHLALKERAELEKQIEQLKGNSIELRKRRSLRSFDTLYIKEKHTFLIFTIKEITFIPYKLFFLEIIISSHQKFLEASNNTEMTKNLVELKILYNSLNNVVDERKEKSVKGITLPHQIALLKEIGFFDLGYFKTISATKRNDIIAKLLNSNARSIKGNISALDPNSNENLSKYTSYNYTDEVKNYLFKL